MTVAESLKVIENEKKITIQDFKNDIAKLVNLKIQKDVSSFALHLAVLDNLSLFRDSLLLEKGYFSFLKEAYDILSEGSYEIDLLYSFLKVSKIEIDLKDYPSFNKEDLIPSLIIGEDFSIKYVTPYLFTENERIVLKETMRDFFKYFWQPLPLLKKIRLYRKYKWLMKKVWKYDVIIKMRVDYKSGCKAIVRMILQMG